MKMLRVRFHGRGGQGAKVANRILGTAAFIEGYHAQDFPLYGAERRGAPIAAFTRISREQILERGVISNPDVVIIMDETLLDDPLAHPLSGLKQGGTVFVNTMHSQSEVKDKYMFRNFKLFKDEMLHSVLHDNKVILSGIEESNVTLSAEVITLDITKIGLEMLGKLVLSALAGGIASKISGLGEDALKRAVEKELSEFIPERELVVKNREAAVHCYRAIRPVKIETTEAEHKGSPVIDLPFEPAIVSSPAINTVGNTPSRKTGNWRVFKPVWNYDMCTKCMICVARCPDGCITVNEDGFPCTDYDNCKGCMICVEECPSKAIERVREVHAW